jgi:cell division septum initiation protein DivIVA
MRFKIALCTTVLAGAFVSTALAEEAPPAPRPEAPAASTPRPGQAERLAALEAAKVAREKVMSEAKADLKEVNTAARLAHLKLIAERKAACKAAKADATGSTAAARAACKAARATAKAGHEQIRADADAARKAIHVKATAALEALRASFKESVGGK